MSSQNKSYAAKIRKKLRSQKIEIDPLLDGALEELERLENIRSALYNSYLADQNVLTTYTNKGGNTNIIVNVAVKEYKMYTQRFNEMTKTLDLMLKTRVSNKVSTNNALDRINGRERM